MPRPVLWVAALLLGLSACQQAYITKTYTEKYTDAKTGKEITYTESITQGPDSRLPMHLKHAELYE